MDLIETTIQFVKQTLKEAEGGHDWFHIQRVYNNALLIAEGELCDRTIVTLGALLHDIADSKFHQGDESIGPKLAKDFLENQQVSPDVIEAVVKIIENISFTGGKTKSKYKSIELDIVQDADRLDAIGAIGIARAFNYGGFKNRAIYNPEIKPNLKMTVEDYKNSQAPTINHFYEKLLLLKNKMNTTTAKKIAKQRHQFMELYLKQFYKEWEGEKL
jgi:uncharacterized protein